MRVGLIGLGSMGRNHARVIKSIPGLNFVAAFDPMYDGADTSEEFPIVNKLADLIQEKPDYCVVATPTATHANIAIELIENGIRVLIEKPIANSSASAETILAHSRSRSVLAGVGHVERFNSALMEAKRRISLGEIGEVYQISTRRIGPFPARVTDVGVTLDLATHDIDLTSWLTDSKYEMLFAQSIINEKRKQEDLISVVGRLKNGIIINHNVNWLSPLKERKTIITGENGTFVVDTLRSDLTFYASANFENTQREIAYFKGDRQGEVTIHAFEKFEPLVVEHLEFIKAINGQKSNYVTLEQAGETLKVAELINESALRNQVVFP